MQITLNFRFKNCLKPDFEYKIVSNEEVLALARLNENKETIYYVDRKDKEVIEFKSIVHLYEAVDAICNYFQLISCKCLTNIENIEKCIQV